MYSKDFYFKEKIIFPSFVNSKAISLQFKIFNLPTYLTDVNFNAKEFGGFVS